jgi:PadR family transcriptional regulator PadR
MARSSKPAPPSRPATPPAAASALPGPERLDLVQGTLDMLILRTLQWGEAHGHDIALAIARESGELLCVDHGSLYPALQRLQQEGWLAASWGTSKNNRRAKYYRLTAAGRRHLHSEATRWQRVVDAIGRIMGQWPVRDTPG